MRSLQLCTRALAVLLLASVAATAQVPRTISFQGVLANADGSLIPDGNHTITLYLYDAPNAASAIYTEQHTVPVVKGIFNVIIGSVSPIPTSIGFDRAYFLGVAVDRGPELQPRTALTAAPYALRAEVANDLAPTAGVVRSLNTRTGPVNIVGSGATTVTQAGNTITVHSTGTGGSAGIQGIQSLDGTIDVASPNGPVTTLSLADGAVTESKIAAAAVTNDKLGAGAVTTDKIATGAVTAPKLAAGAVRTVAIADSAITQAKFAAGVRLPPSGEAGGALVGTYPNPELANAVVKNQQLATDAVTGDKIANGTITGADISGSAALAVGTLSTSGNAAVGTTLGGARLMVRGMGSGLAAASTAMAVADNTGGALLVVRDNGSVGVNLGAPLADVDIAGIHPVALQMRAGALVLSTGAVVAAPVVTLPPLMSVRITNDGVPAPITLVFPPGVPGQTMIVINDDLDPVVAPVAIAPGQARLFTFVAGAFRLVN